MAGPNKGRVHPGLKNLFPGRVKVVALGKGGSYKGQSPDYNILIPDSAITPQVFESLASEMRLTEKGRAAIYPLIQAFGPRGWFTGLRGLKVGLSPVMDPTTNEPMKDQSGKLVYPPNAMEEWCRKNNVHLQVMKTLKADLMGLFSRRYIKPDQDVPDDGMGRVVEDLKQGYSVILSFGKETSFLDYLLVTAVLGNKVADWDQIAPNQHLVIALEEAHRILQKGAETFFAKAAREMRKKNVTLVIIDQRPSQIDNDVMSQVSRRLSGWLGDQSDIRAALSGVANAEELQSIMATLEAGKSFMIAGNFFTMPAALRMRDYGEVVAEIKAKAKVKSAPKKDAPPDAQGAAAELF